MKNIYASNIIKNIRQIIRISKMLSKNKINVNDARQKIEAVMELYYINLSKWSYCIIKKYMRKSFYREESVFEHYIISIAYKYYEDDYDIVNIEKTQVVKFWVYVILYEKMKNILSKY